MASKAKKPYAPDTELVAKANKIKSVGADFGVVVGAAKATWIGTALLGKVRLSELKTHALQVALDLAVASAGHAPHKCSILVSPTAAGAVVLDSNEKVAGGKSNPTKQSRAAILLKNAKDEVHDALTDSTHPLFFAYITHSSIVAFKQVHVFAMKKKGAATGLATHVAAMASPATEDVSAHEATSEVFHAKFLGNMPVSSKKWWKTKAHNFPSSGSNVRTDDDMFKAALVVGGGALTSAEQSETVIENESGILMNENSIQIVDVLSQHEVCNFQPNRVLAIRSALPPGVTSTMLGDRSLAIGQLPDLDRAQLQRRIESAEITEEAAIDEALVYVSAHARRIVLIMHQDPEVGTVAIASLLCSGGSEYALRMVAAIESAKEAAIKALSDPFKPMSQSSMRLPLPKGINESSELDRNLISAVESLGKGQFGEVYLANHSIPIGSLAADAPALNNAIPENGMIERQVAVKICKANIAPKSVLEFQHEAELQLSLDHVNIAKVLGVCFTQKPFMVVLELILYGDLQNVMQTCSDKQVYVLPITEAFIMAQIAEAMAFVASKKIVHLDLAARNCLVHSKTHVKLADFGLARRYTAGKEGWNLKGKMKVPFKWCPPECLPRKLWSETEQFYEPMFSEKSDMWAFGVTCWEIATYGDKPYGKTKLVETLKSIDMDGLRLAWPADSDPYLLKIGKDKAMAEDATDRPTFAGLAAEINEKIALQLSEVQDLGAILNAPREEKLRKASTWVTETRRAHWTVLKATMKFKALLKNKPGFKGFAAKRESSGAAPPALGLPNINGLAVSEEDSGAPVYRPVYDEFEDGPDARQSPLADSVNAGYQEVPRWVATADASVIEHVPRPTLLNEDDGASSAPSRGSTRRTSFQLDAPASVADASYPGATNAQSGLYNESDWVLGANGQVERSTTTSVADVKPSHVRPVLTKSYQRGALFKGDLFDRFHLFHVDSSDDDEGEEAAGMQWKTEIGTPAPHYRRKPLNNEEPIKEAAKTKPNKSALKKTVQNIQGGGVRFVAATPKAKEAGGVRFAAAPPQVNEPEADDETEEEDIEVAGEDSSGYGFDAQFANYGDDGMDDSVAVGGHQRTKQPWYTSGGGINTFGKFPKTLHLTFKAHDLDAVGSKYTSDPFVVITRPKPVVISKATARRAGKPIEVYKSETKKQSLHVTWKTIEISPDKLCGARHDLDVKLKASVYSNASTSSFGSKVVLLGDCTFTLRELMDAYHPSGAHPELPLRWPLINIQRKDDEHAGELMLIAYGVEGVDVDVGRRSSFGRLSQGDAGLF
jgi:serine/threonine protein kinase